MGRFKRKETLTDTQSAKAQRIETVAIGYIERYNPYEVHANSGYHTNIGFYDDDNDVYPVGTKRVTFLPGYSRRHSRDTNGAKRARFSNK